MVTVTREQKAIAAWTQAMATAENYAIDPHRHIALLVQAGEQMAALLTPGSAATSPPATVTREQLQSIEWSANVEALIDGIVQGVPACPACGAIKPADDSDIPFDGHDVDCWLSEAILAERFAALAAPPPDETRAVVPCVGCPDQDRCLSYARCIKAAQAPPPDPPGLKQEADRLELAQPRHVRL